MKGECLGDRNKAEKGELKLIANITFQYNPPS